MLTWQMSGVGEKDVAMWRCTNTPRGAHACVWACAHVWAGVIREITLPFQDNVISLNHLYLIYALKSHNFCHVRLCFYF